MALTQVTTHGIKDATVATADISNDSITSAKIISNSITSSELANGAVTNTEVASDAAIAGSKISPDFGSQDITTTGHLDLPDNSQLKLGNSQDLKLYHDGSHSVIEATNGTGNLYVKHNSQIFFQNSSGNESHIVLNPHGSVELYYDNSKKLETTSAGATVTGDLHLADNNAIKLGSAQEVQINHTGSSTNFIVSQHYLNFQANGTFFYNQAGNETKLSLLQNGAVSLYYDNSKKLETTSTGIYVDSNIRVGTTTGSVSGGNALIMSAAAGSRVKLCRDATGVGSSDGFELIASADSTAYLWNREDTDLLFGTNGTERLRIKNDGNIQIPADSKKLQIGAGQDLALYHDGSNSFIDDAGTGYLRIRGSEVRLQKTSSAEDMLKGISDGAVELYYDNSKKLETNSSGVNVIGSLTVNGSAISGGGISDIVEDTSPQLGGDLQSNGNDIDFADNDAAFFGTGNDLKIFHSGSHSQIVHSGTGNVFLDSIGGSVNLRAGNNAGGVHNSVICNLNEDVELYYDNSKKLETTSTGIAITGRGTFTDGNSGGVRIGNSDDLQLYHDTVNSYIRNNTGFLIIEGGTQNSSILIRPRTTENSIKADSNGAVELYYDNSKKFETVTGGVSVTGILTATNAANSNSVFASTNNNTRATIELNGKDSSGNQVELRLGGFGDTTRGEIFTATNHALGFATNNAAAQMTLDTSGNLNIVNDSGKIRLGASADLQLYHDGSNSRIHDSGTGVLAISGDEVDIQNAAQSENCAKFIQNAQVELYYDNSKKFETTANGAKVTGNYIELNKGSSAGTAFIIDTTATSGATRFRFRENGSTKGQIVYSHDNNQIELAGDSGQNAAILVNFSEYALRAIANGSTKVYYNGNERFQTTSLGTESLYRAQFTQSGNDFAMKLDATNSGFSTNIIKIHAIRGAANNWAFIAADSNHGGGADREFTIRGDGNAYADGTWNNNGADYAEFFESSTGSAIAVGTTVVLENNKVRAATSNDAVGNIIGVVRPKEASQASMTIGNTAWNKWQGKYLTDDFDRYILDEHNVIEWTDADGKEHSYESHAIPSDVNVPSEPTIKTQDENGNKFTHYRLNPNYNSERTYVPRHDRDEWVIVGLVGQVKVLKGQPANDRWIKMRDVSDTVQEYFIR